MKIVKLSSKGQILIPKAMRDELCLLPGAEFLVSMTGVGLSLVPKTFFPKTKVENVRGVLAKQDRNLHDDDTINAHIKKRLKAQDGASKT